MLATANADVHQNPAAAQAAAWRAYAAAPDDPAARGHLVGGAAGASGDRPGARGEPAGSARDRRDNPRTSTAPDGCCSTTPTACPPPRRMLRPVWSATRSRANCSAPASRRDPLARALGFSALRRWPMATRRWSEHPGEVAAVVAKADQWRLLDDRRRGAGRVDAEPHSPIVAVDGPRRRCCSPCLDFCQRADPYGRGALCRAALPRLVRATVGKPTTLPALVENVVRARDRPARRRRHPIAGSDTGLESAQWALRCPDARTPRSILAPSVVVDADRCAATGIAIIAIHCLDLHEVRRWPVFDAWCAAECGITPPSRRPAAACWSMC